MVDGAVLMMLRMEVMALLVEVGEAAVRLKGGHSHDSCLAACLP